MGNHAALIRSQESGKPVLRRGRNFIEFDLGGNQRRYVTTIDPLHVRSNGSEIDTTWGAGDAVYQWRITEADYISEAKSAFNGAPLIRYTNRETGEWVSLQPRQLEYNNDRGDVQLVAGVTSASAQSDGDSTLTWVGAFGSGIDYQWINHPEKLIKNLILQNNSVLPSPSAQILGGANPVLRHQFQFAWSSGMNVWINGIQWDEVSEISSTGRIEFRTTTGSTILFFDAPVVVDSSGSNINTGGILKLSRSGPNLLVGVRVPISWLQSATYPVVIDPTFTDGFGGDVTTYKDTSIESETASTGGSRNYGGATNIWFGHRSTWGGEYRSFLQFNVAPLSGCTVTSGSLQLYLNQNIAGTTNDLVTSAYRMVQSWDEGTQNGVPPPTDGMTWWVYNADATGSWAGNGASNTPLDHEASPIAVLALPFNAPLGSYKTWWISASAIQDWVDGDVTNNGIALFSGSALETLKQFSSAENSNTNQRPIFKVDYTLGSASAIVSGSVAFQGSGFLIPTGVVLVQDIQYARPIADISSGSWLNELGGSTNLYQSIDETTASDLDYIVSNVGVVNLAEFLLTSGSDPVTSASHTLKYRYSKGGSGSAVLVVTLLDGASTTASWIHNISASDVAWHDQTQTLSATEADSISDYTNLRLRFTAYE